RGGRPRQPVTVKTPTHHVRPPWHDVLRTPREDERRDVSARREASPMQHWVRKQSREMTVAELDQVVPDESRVSPAALHLGGRPVGHPATVDRRGGYRVRPPHRPPPT